MITLLQKNNAKEFVSTPIWLAGLLAAVVSLSACASAPKPPDQALQAAELAITNADRERVVDYASPELVEARTKLQAARASVQEKEMGLAERLALEARYNAELATAKARAIKAKAVNDEMIKGIDTLKAEMQRNTGVGQ